MKINEHFKEIDDGTRACYVIAEAARKKGFDPENSVETPIATSLAEKAVGLISVVYPQVNDKKIVNRILELEKEYGQLDPTVSFKIAEEIAREKYCKFKDLLEAIDAGIRVGFSYVTLGVVSSPIEGYTGLKLGKTRDGKDYFKVYFSGPIRSAGTTAGCVVLMLIDYLRESFGFAKYDPSEDEVKRYVTENYDYHERVTNLQYLPTQGEITDLAKNLPIQIAGEPTEQREVSNYKDLDRVETNFIRGGMCLIFSEGLAQKAQKGLRLLKRAKENGIESTGFDFLDEFLEKHKKKASGKGDGKPVYIKDLVAGRPVFGHPSRSGGFRFRYGRSRTGGFSATLVHPATMAISNSFLSTGTQLKIEKPTKGCAISVCDEMDGPIVKMKDGSVKVVKTYEEGKEIYKDVEEIIYFGDLLFPFGDVLNRNYDLIKPGYVEEWWGLEIEKKSGKKLGDLKIDKMNVKFKDALEFSREYGVPLHPRYIYYWNQINLNEFYGLLDWLSRAVVKDRKIIFPYLRVDKERFILGKRALELLGVEHDVGIENVIIKGETAESFLFNLGILIEESEGEKLEEIVDEVIGNANEERKKFKEGDKEGKEILRMVNAFCEIEIKDKAGEFIGARMGRPEKAKLRKLTGSPHSLFPVGEEGGRLRSFQAALEKGYVSGEFLNYYCRDCKKEEVYKKCSNCGADCLLREQESKFADQEPRKFSKRRIDIRDLFDKAKKISGVSGDEIPIVKGIRGTSNADHTTEHLAKGLLRAKYGLNVNKDGTIRYDMTEMAITHFKPNEIGTDIERLKKLGYERDIYGVKLEDVDQILELKPHDIILPSCPEGDDENADDVFLKVSKFIDDELERIYGLERFYKLESKKDLVGHLFVCIAPHICTATVGRVIGFSKVQALMASPYMHAAMRRDCFDYDTYFPIKGEDGWKIAKIGELVEGLNLKKVVDSYGTKEEKVEGYSCVGIKKGVGEIKINKFSKHAKREIYEIKTALGKKIKVTENHKFFINGKKKRATDLLIGDEIQSPIKIDIKSIDKKEINLFEELKKEKGLMVRGIRELIRGVNEKKLESLLKKLDISKRSFENYFRRDSFPAPFVEKLGRNIREKIFRKGKIGFERDNVSVPIVVRIDNDILELIGLYVAEGYSRTVNGYLVKGLNQVYISAMNGEIRKFVKDTVKKNFGLVPSEKKQDRVTYSSKILYLFFTKVLRCESVAREKRIPSMFLDLPLEKLASIMRGYFEGDGSAETNRRKISCDSVSEGLLNDLEFCLTRFGIYAKRYEYEKEPGEKLKKFYLKKGRSVPKFKITKLILNGRFAEIFRQNIGFISNRKKRVLEGHEKIREKKTKIREDGTFVYDPVISIESLGERESYCLNVDSKEHIVCANSLLSFQCDGDEAATMLLMDLLLNFSKKFLPAHRGGTQDAPLVLNTQIRAGEVDDQILDVVLGEYPLELYTLSEEGKHSSDVKIETVKDRLASGEDPFTNICFSHGCADFNAGVLNSSYKKLPTMQEKVHEMMDLCKKLRAVDTSDAARLIIERHFIRDTRGNLRKFSMQGFRCVGCNGKYRRPPLAGKCNKCGGKIIFTISEGSIMKYMQPALDLAENYKVSNYLKESLDLTEMYIQSIFGKDSEKQETISKWM